MASSLAYVREGVGGYPLVLVHGYPETKRIWWRNIEPLVAAGFEVVVPDLRGHGDSDLSADDTYDIVTYSRDLRTLMHDVLGHQRYGIAAGDVGGVVGVDMALRFEGDVEGLCFFDTVPPILVEEYVAAGIDLGAMTAIGDGPTGGLPPPSGPGARRARRRAVDPGGSTVVGRGDVRAPPLGVAGHVLTG